MINNSFGIKTQWICFATTFKKLCQLYNVGEELIFTKSASGVTIWQRICWIRQDNCLLKCLNFKPRQLSVFKQAMDCLNSVTADSISWAWMSELEVRQSETFALLRLNHSLVWRLISETHCLTSGDGIFGICKGGSGRSRMFCRKLYKKLQKLDWEGARVLEVPLDPPTQTDRRTKKRQTGFRSSS